MKARYTLILPIIFVTIAGLNGQGLKFNNKSYQNILKKSPLFLLKDETLPSKVNDLQKYVPSIINQENTNTCVGMATTYYMRTILEAKKRKLKTHEEIDAIRFSPSYVYNAIKDTTHEASETCNINTEITDALNFIKDLGALKYDEQSDLCTSENVNRTPQEESKILDFIRLFGLTYNQSEKINATKKALAEGSPVVVGVELTPSIEELSFWNRIWGQILQFFGISSDSNEELSLWKPENSDYLEYGHAMCVVGYDNKKFKNGAFQLVNSYGPEWGKNGFFWIRYSDYEKYAKYAFQAFLPPTKNTAIADLSAEVYFEYNINSENNIVPFSNVDILQMSRANQKNLISYTFTEPQETGRKYKISAKLSTQSYLYVLSKNEITDAQKLFPQGDTLSALIGPNNRVKVPEGNKPFALNAPIGREYCLFLFSPKPLNIDYLIRKINRSEGNFSEQIHEVFEADLVPVEQVKYNTNRMGFELKGNHKGEIVPLLISFDQIAKVGQ